MWIRSRKRKTLIDTTHCQIYIYDDTKGKIFVASNSADADDFGVCVGEYGNRSMKILDEIQNAIVKGESLFQMPKE